MRFFSILMSLFFMLIPAKIGGADVDISPSVAQVVNESLAQDSKSAILMEQSTGQVLFAKNENQRLPIASVTKVMTMLLAMEAFDSGLIKEDTILTCSEYASSMGGSQIYLERGEQMTANDVMKAIAVASGNDAAVMLSEHLAGSEAVFVAQMNAKAEELGMTNTHFINPNGLDEGSEAYSSARDVAIMSRELMQHKGIEKFLTIWQDSLRDGEFALANTNKLVRYYAGATGIKTGSTDAALYCLSASATRDNMGLIAVVLGADTTEHRFGNATALLDYGFATYAVAGQGSNALELAVEKGATDTVLVRSSENSGIVVPKSKANQVKKEVALMEHVIAPVKEGDILGEVRYTLNDEVIMTQDLLAAGNVEKIGILQMFFKLTQKTVDKDVFSW